MEFSVRDLGLRCPWSCDDVISVSIVSLSLSRIPLTAHHCDHTSLLSLGATFSAVKVRWRGGGFGAGTGLTFRCFRWDFRRALEVLDGLDVLDRFEVRCTSLDVEFR
jgi:hypothetical protein